MENDFLDKVEDNAVVRICLKELKEIWDQWSDETKQLFYSNYGDLLYLFDIKVDEQLFPGLAQYWNPAYSYFNFGKVDLVPTVEEYTALLRCSRFQVDKAYSRAAYVPAFWKRLMNIKGMSEQWITVRIKQKGYVEEAVSDLFDRLDKGVTPILAILAETFRISYQVFSENYSPLKEIMAMPRRDNISEENWIALLQNLQEEDVQWKAPWLIPDKILYRCGIFDWVPLLGIWGAIGYTPLLVLRQYGSRQFVPATHGLAQFEFSFWGDNYMKRSKRINDNIPESNSEDVRPMEEYLQVIPSELEIIKQDFERRNLELKKKIEQLEEEKMHLRLDADVQKLEAEKLRKGKNKAEEDLDSLKTDYKKLHLSMRTTGLGRLQNSGDRRFEKKSARLIGGKGNAKRLKCKTKP
ncbi:hypothetical protein Goarm_000065 [Gossypium armourianum]|uniref:DUF7745 domain-containing protein n=1 Tax=Gossypium armourianum TaxID=34283 RepID=A0A7J9KFB5_9ROSI|nr:hypothetical protein [Gossypium armourianum]